jgi:hypothetical protein
MSRRILPNALAGLAMICLAQAAARESHPSATPRLVSLSEAAASNFDVSCLRYISEEYGDYSPGPSTLMTWSSNAEADGGPPGWDEPLASDRPDFTEASCTVGRGVSQLEMGFTYAFDDNGGTRTESYSVPEALLRIGVFADWLELRFAWNYASETVTTGGIRTTASGSEDLYLGLKLGLTPQQGILPEMALVPQMTVPLGSPFSANEVLPGLNWLYGWEISECLSTAGSTQINLAVDPGSGNEYCEFAQSWTIGYTLAEKLGAYTEWFVLAPAGADTAGTEHYLNGGFIYNISNNLQLDIRVGKGISGAATDFFAGTGLVARF